MEQSRAPLWEAIINYHKKRVIPFHTPGHKLRSGVFPSIAAKIGKQVWTIDASDEVEDITHDHCFTKVLAKAEKLAAALFNCDSTRFLVNGTSSGIHAMLLGLSGPVVIPRFSHQSVFGGLILSGAKPIYIPAHIDQEWNIPILPSSSEIEQAVKSKRAQAVLLTNPSYYGTVTDLDKIAAVVHRHNAYLFVDEAHGSHFTFSSRLPQSAIKVNADLVVHSTHKTLGSLTQSSMLHVNNHKLVAKIDNALTILQSTSPSMVLLGVLDAVRRELAYRGKTLVGRAIELAENLHTEIETVKGVKVAPKHFTNDYTKIVFNMCQLGLKGAEVEKLLRRDYNIQVELSDFFNVLVLITIGDTQQSIGSLVAAIKDIAHRFKNKKPLKQVKLPDSFSVPQQALDMSAAIKHETEQVDLAHAIGRIAAGFVTPYPPGVPLVVPGEIIDRNVVDYLCLCCDQGWEVRPAGGENITVIKD